MEKPSLEEPFFLHNFLQLSQLEIKNPENQDMEGQLSPNQDALQSPQRRGNKKLNSGQKSGRRSKKSEQQLKEQNHGHWLPEENKRYHWFLQIHYQHFVNSHMRRTDKIFKTMQIFVGTRQAEQCRSHHQKMEKKHNNFTNILAHFRNENYKDTGHQGLQQDLDELSIQYPDGIANQQELDACRKIQEEARRKYGKRRNYHRNKHQKLPTPKTQHPEVNPEPPQITQGHPQESQLEQEQRDEVSVHEQRLEQQPNNEINMLDESHQNNIGEISVFNERDEVSCLFNSSFLHQ